MYVIASELSRRKFVCHSLRDVDGTVTVISRTSLILANCLAIGAACFTMQRDRGFSYIVGDSRGRTLAGVLLWDGKCISRLVNVYSNEAQYRVHLLYVSGMNVSNAHSHCLTAQHSHHH